MGAPVLLARRIAPLLKQYLGPRGPSGVKETFEPFFTTLIAAKSARAPLFLLEPRIVLRPSLCIMSAMY